MSPMHFQNEKSGKNNQMKPIFFLSFIFNYPILDSYSGPELIAHMEIQEWEEIDYTMKLKINRLEIHQT